MIGLEPTRLAALVPKTSVSTNSTTSARCIHVGNARDFNLFQPFWLYRFGSRRNNLRSCLSTRWRNPEIFPLIRLVSCSSAPSRFSTLSKRSSTWSKRLSTCSKRSSTIAKRLSISLKPAAVLVAKSSIIGLTVFTTVVSTITSIAFRSVFVRLMTTV